MLTIVTIANKHPEFIEWQYLSLRHFIKEDFNYIVFDSSGNQDISSVCKNLQIENIRLKHEIKDPSLNVAGLLNEMWNSQVKDFNGILFYIDSDMFLINNFDIGKIIENYDLAFVPQPAGYMWTGTFIFNMDTIAKNIDFSICVLPEGKSDVGGKTYYFLREKNYRIRRLEFYTLEDQENLHFRFSKNGRYGPYEVKKETLTPEEEVKYGSHFNLINCYDFPRPYSFDLIKVEDLDMPFAFHYKSAGWMDRGSLYESRKKGAVKMMLSQRGVL